jgi:AmmeMemoRadiSam system protein B
MPAAVAHSSPFSGWWYPASASELEAILRSAFEISAVRTGPAVRPHAIAFVVPHAAPMYSGVVAAAAYRHIALRHPARIVLLGFSHHGGGSGVEIPDIGAISTPFGDVPFDEGMMRSLARRPVFRVSPESAICDHSVEIQLPFIQWTAPEALVIPLYVGRLSRAERAAAAAALQSVLDDAVLIASSDLTHYGRDFGYTPFPPDAHVAEHLRQLDGRIIVTAATLDPEAFLDEIGRTRSTTCGYEPIALLLETLRYRRVVQHTLDYQTSGELTGNYTHSVSYAAVGYFPAEPS